MRFLPYIMLFILISSCKRQEESVLHKGCKLVIQPGSDKSRDITIQSNYPDSTINDLYLKTDNTVNGEAIKFLMCFDLSQIPSDVTIDSAFLYLFSNSDNNPLNGSAEIVMINEIWGEGITSWKAKPTCSEANKIDLCSVSKTISKTNITAFAQQWIHQPTTNYGIQVQTKSQIKNYSLTFYSSNYPIDSLRPKIEIFYSINYQKTCMCEGNPHPGNLDSIVVLDTLNLQPDAMRGIDSYISSVIPDSTGAYSFKLGCGIDDSNNEFRSLLRFNLTSINKNLIYIDTAILYLYSLDNATDNIDDFSLYPVLFSWKENITNWKNQPAVTDIGKVNVQSTNDVAIDITSLLSTWAFNPLINFGVMLKIQSTSPSHQRFFCSSDYLIASKRPRLFIAYRYKKVAK